MSCRKRPWLLPGILWVLWVSVYTCSPAAFGDSAAAGPPAAGALLEKPAAAGRIPLWKVRSETSTVYLLGSIHFATKDIYPLDGRIEAAFERSDHLVVELNLGSANRAAIARKMAGKAVYPQGDSLAAHVSSEVVGRLKDYMEKNGLPTALFDRFKPWFAALNLVLIEGQKLGLDPRLGIDLHFIRKAEGNKSILELEGADEQLNLFDQLSDELQELFLKSSLLEVHRMGGIMADIVKAWKSGDAEAVEGLLFESRKRHPELNPVYEKLINERNMRMAEKIEGYLKTNSTYFIVVGFGHLVGERGIIELMKRRNFAVEQEPAGAARVRR